MYSILTGNATSESQATTQPAQPAPRDGWGILLIDSSQSPFLFVRTLANGIQGVAQLCLSLDDEEYVVRKRAFAPITDVRSARPDRECRIARAIQERQAQLPPGAATNRYEFASLLSNGNLFVDNQYFRESYWRFYDGGDLVDFIRFLHYQQLRPHALILELAHSCLLALQWLNSIDIVHLDAHLGNIFLRWNGDKLVPVIVRTIR